MKKIKLYTQTQKLIATTLLFNFLLQSCTNTLESLRAGEGTLAQTNNSAHSGLNSTNLTINNHTPNTSAAMQSHLIERAKRIDNLRGNPSQTSKATAKTLNSMGFSKKAQPNVYRVMEKALADPSSLASIKKDSPLWHIMKESDARQDAFSKIAEHKYQAAEHWFGDVSGNVSMDLRTKAQIQAHEIVSSSLHKISSPLKKEILENTSTPSFLQKASNWFVEKKEKISGYASSLWNSLPKVDLLPGASAAKPEPEDVFSKKIKSQKRMLANSNTPIEVVPEFQIYTAKYPAEPAVAVLSNGNALVTWAGSYVVFTSNGTKIISKSLASSGPSVVSAALPNGNFVIAWNRFNQNDTVCNVIAQVFASDGTEVGHEFQVNTYTNGTQAITNYHSQPLTTLPNGNFVITWTGDGGNGGYGQIFASDGTKVGSDFQVTNTTDSENLLTVSALSNSNFFIVWGNNGIYAQVFASDGTKIGSEFQVNTTHTYGQSTPSVSVLSNGNFVITWNIGGPYGSSRGVYVQIFASDGTKIGSGFRVNTSTYETEFPIVSALSNGNFFITWSSNGQDGSGYGVYAQVFASDGTKIGSEFQVNTYTSYNQMMPEISALSNGDFVIAWLSDQDRSGAYGFGVYGQIFSSTGTPLGKEFKISTYTSDQIQCPKVASLSTNQFIVVWQSKLQDGSGYGEYGRIFADNDTNLAPTGLLINNQVEVPENQVGFLAGTFATTDPNVTDAFTYTLVSGTGSDDNAKFTIDSNGNLKTAVALDYEQKQQYNIRVRTTDSGGLFYEKTFTIVAKNVNEPPTDLTLNNQVEVPENQIGFVVGTFATTDPDTYDTFTYSFVSGTGSDDNAKFTIDSNGNLKTAVALDYEQKQQYNIRVRTTDSGGLYYEKAFTIVAKNVNEPPTDLTLNNQVEVPENQIGLVVGTFATTDPDAHDTFTYSFVPGTGSYDNAKFTIDSNGNLKTAVALDYEQKQQYSIRVRTTDAGGLYYEIPFIIKVKKSGGTTTPPPSLRLELIVGLSVGLGLGIPLVGLGGYCLYSKYREYTLRNTARQNVRMYMNPSVAHDNANSPLI